MKKRDPPVLPERGGGRMSSCNTKSGIRTGTKQDKPTRTSTKIKGVSCSCGQLCKNFRGLKLHQVKAKCQASENKLTGPDKRCFVSLTDILNTSFLKFGDTIYCKTFQTLLFQFVTLINLFLQPNALLKPMIL